MDDQLNPALNDVFSFHLNDPGHVHVGSVPSSQRPVKLSLTSQDRPDLKRANATPPKGAILDMYMSREVALSMLEQLYDAAQKMGWPLPTAKQPQA
jgi:hypothetical protein